MDPRTEIRKSEEFEKKKLFNYHCDLSISATIILDDLSTLSLLNSPVFSLQIPTSIRFSR